MDGVICLQPLHCNSYELSALTYHPEGVCCQFNSSFAFFVARNYLASQIINPEIFLEAFQKLFHGHFFSPT